MCELNPGHTYGVYLVLSLKPSATLKQHQGGSDVEAPGVPTQSPPRNRGDFGDPNISTNIDP